MVLQEGRILFKQYIKNKPVGWGIKRWVLFEANKSYVFNFQFYLVQEDRQEEEHLCLQYKEFMGKVDLADQIQQIFKVIHKSNKAWKKFSIMGLKCVCVLNSFTILKKVKLTCQELFYFRIAIVHHFLEGKSFPAGHPLSRPPSVMDARRLNRQYY